MTEVRESDTLKLITDWLTAKRVWWLRMNTGAMSAEYKGKKRFVRFCRPGVADILAVRYTTNWVHVLQNAIPRETSYLQVVWLEIKAPKGVQGPAQKEFQSEVEAQGMTYILAKSLEDVEKVFA